MGTNATLRILGEAIILQSLEDLWNDDQRADSLNFFRGEGFSLCASIAGIGTVDQLRLLRMTGWSAEDL